MVRDMWSLLVELLPFAVGLAVTPAVLAAAQASAEPLASEPSCSSSGPLFTLKGLASL
jgi:hypothetical protein